jgi:hypothetical protein
MNFSELQKIDSQSTVELFNVTVDELSTVLGRKFRRDEHGSYKCIRNGRRYCIPRPLTLQDVRSSFWEEDGKKISCPIMFYSQPIKKGDEIVRHEVNIEYNPQFLEGAYRKRLPEVCVSLYGSEIPMSCKVIEKMKDLNLQPREKTQALSDRNFICASLNI